MHKVYLKAVNNKFPYYLKCIGKKYFVYSENVLAWVRCKNVKITKLTNSKYYIDTLTFHINIKSEFLNKTLTVTPAIHNINSIDYGIKIFYKLKRLKPISPEEIFLVFL